MPLVKGGRVVDDPYTRIADDKAVPETLPVLVPAARLVGDAADLCREAPTGVLWPNSRRVSELKPYLNRLSLIALNFPTFRDGRAYSQARLLREQYGFRGELRATGQVLRDQFLFLVRAGFDSFEVVKESDAARLVETIGRYRIFYQPTGDGRPSALRQRMARPDGAAGPATGQTEGPGQTPVPALNRKLESASPVEVIAEAMLTLPRGRLAVVSSFGTESAPLLKLVADVDRSLPVLFLDTGWLFDETMVYRDALVKRLGLTDVRIFKPSPSMLATRDPRRELWLSDPDACCWLRKVVPLAEALQPFDAWINGRKRYHGQDRANLAVVEHDGHWLKFNPFARTSKQELDSLFEAFDLPRHPLEARGFASIGCIPCTSRTYSGEELRSGRWRGLAKAECGIHAPLKTRRAIEPTDNLQRRQNDRDVDIHPSAGI